MIEGKANPNEMTPLEKMTIKNLEKNASIKVLYNPTSYTQERKVQYGKTDLLNSDASIQQFQSGGTESLSFDLFFDTSADDTDVRQHTSKVYSLTFADETKHRPPELQITWSSLQFKCFLATCSQQFVKFNKDGAPIRAILKCTFIESRDMNQLFAKKSPESPDTTKYRTVREGDSLWAMAYNEYGETAQWREIAAANGLDNPRKLRAGTLLVVPALLD